MDQPRSLKSSFVEIIIANILYNNFDHLTKFNVHLLAIIIIKVVLVPKLCEPQA